MLHTLTENIWGLHFVLRWLHLFFGIVWIGLLYYFNFVQGSFMAETTEAVAKSQVTQKLVPRALWWFRWGAMWTFVTGATMIMIRAHIDVRSSGTAILATPYWMNILTGAFFATLMFLNVWLIIWPKQKIVIANAVATAGGAAANPAVPAAAARAGVASRTNVLFSIPMMFFMVGANHLGYAVGETSNVTLYWILAAVIILGLELNAIKGKNGPMTTVKGVISCGFALTLLFSILLTVLV
jgi:uncharacterized membrane protein